MEYPDDRYYTENHEWLKVDRDSETARVGITDFAQHELGDIVFVELDPVETDLSKDDTFGVIEAVKTVSDLYMPVSGTITAVNEALEQNPELVNQDPYGDGWMVEVDVDDLEEVDSLMEAADYSSHVSS